MRSSPDTNNYHLSASKKSISMHDEDECNINDHGLLNKHHEGMIVLFGHVHFTKGIVYGIELINGSIGKHDGMLDNERYFQVLLILYIYTTYS